MWLLSVVTFCYSIVLLAIGFCLLFILCLVFHFLPISCFISQDFQSDILFDFISQLDLPIILPHFKTYFVLCIFLMQYPGIILLVMESMAALLLI